MALQSALPMILTTTVIAMLLTTAPLQAESGDSTGIRLGTQVVSASLAAFGGGYAGFMIAASINCQRNPGTWCSLNGTPGMLPGMVIGALAATQLSGWALGGEGRVWGTALGVTAAAVPALFLMYGPTFNDPSRFWATWASLALLTTGAVGGYQLTHAMGRSVRMAVMPSATPDGWGAMVSGSF